MRREPTFAERISFRQTSLVSSNESRFVKWVSFRQMSLVVSNESRFVKRASLWLVSILSNKRVSLKIVYRVTYKSWRFKIEGFPRNREWNRDDLKSSGFPETVSDPSFRQTSLIFTNETRFDSQTNESHWKSFIECLLNRDDYELSGFPETVSDTSFRFSDKRVSLEIVYRVPLKSWRLKIEWFPRNREWSPNYL